MSSVYTSEPATKGKVILVTSAGDLEIELWPKETPKACRNFVQLCMEGYYDDTPIHRIIPKFIVQAGDPTGTGLGGESVYGAPFADEFHSRLKFSHRGLLAMANTGRNTNGSQFFFTLDATPQLNGKNTIFGKVVGNTLFNLLKLGELETDKNDKPLFDARIITSNILSNPFDDIEPRTSREEKAALAKQQEMERIAREKANKPKAKKNLSLLSFGGAAVPDSTTPKSKIQSSHDALGEAAGLSSKVAVEASGKIDKKRKVEQTQSTEEHESEAYEIEMREKALKKVAAAPKSAKKESLQDQIKKLQGEIKQIGAPKAKSAPEPKQYKGSVAKLREEFLKSGKAISAMRKDAKGDVDSKLGAFNAALKDAAREAKTKSKKQPVTADNTEDAWECSLHFIKNCSSCRDTFGEQVSEDDDDWMNASLKFEKEIGANVYQPKIDDYTVVDPRQGAKSDPFGRDIQILGDIQSRKTKIWTEKSTRQIRSAVDQAKEAPEYQRYK